MCLSIMFSLLAYLSSRQQDIESTAEACTDLVRLGCSAAFTIDTTKGGGEDVALVMELKEVPANIGTVCTPLANEIKSAITQEHSLNITSLWFLQPRSVPKTSSGKIARAWCRKGYLNGTLKVVHKQTFKEAVQPLELEANSADTDGDKISNGVSGNTKNNNSLDSHHHHHTEATSSAATSSQPTAGKPGTKGDAAAIRSMSKQEILTRLTQDISRVGSLPADSLKKTTPLVSMLDSLTISQFKGMLENQYSVTLSDEYLFRETTTLAKLVEVVKLGYAPDDNGADGTAANAGNNGSIGQAKGLAGALGCPPGVVCVIL
jgi:acyl carrier protein